MIDDVFQFIGSFASISSIPLAIFLYLRGQQQKYVEVRKQIVKTLSYQIGEGRELSLFEVNAVRDSIIRDKKVRQSSITADSLIEDLISDTLSSPLLSKERKEECIKNIENVHSKAKVFNFLNEHFDSINETSDLGNSTGIEEIKDVLSKNGRKISDVADSTVFFAKSALGIALLVALLPIPVNLQESDFLTRVQHETLWVNIGLSLTVVCVAGFITYLRNKATGKNA